MLLARIVDSVPVNPVIAVDTANAFATDPPCRKPLLLNGTDPVLSMLLADDPTHINPPGLTADAATVVVDIWAAIITKYLPEFGGFQTPIIGLAVPPVVATAFAADNTVFEMPNENSLPEDAASLSGA